MRSPPESLHIISKHRNSRCHQVVVYAVYSLNRDFSAPQTRRALIIANETACVAQCLRMKVKTYESAKDYQIYIFGLVSSLKLPNKFQSREYVRLAHLQEPPIPALIECKELGAEAQQRFVLPPVST
jgi:hypothetical protein